MIQYVKRKIGNVYLLWFKSSNFYLQLEEPAWFVFRRTAKRSKAETIAKEFAKRYELSYKESYVFVNEIRAKIHQLNQPTEKKWMVGENDNDLKCLKFKPYSVHYYRFGNQIIQFSFESRLFEHYIHPLVAHLEINEICSDVPQFELFGYNDKTIFRLNGEVKGVWTLDESNFVKGSIFMTLVNVMFGKTDDFWLMTVHASAITNELKTILFSAGPGSGKTTMAALLQDRGYRLVSDDFVPIDRYEFYAWPFPIAMSVKEGAVDLLSSIYPDLADRPLNYISPEKSVRYLTSQNETVNSGQAFPVQAFVFIRYNAEVEFEWEKLEVFDALKLLLDQAWISPADGIAHAFVNQLDKWSFYQLTYSDNERALEAISNLFEHD